jgi:type IV pilus assembly protein PilE
MRKGFTLLELVIVVIVIGILVSMALPQFTRMAERGRVAKAKAALDMIRKAEGVWFAQNSIYTNDKTATGLGREIPEIVDLATNDTDWAYSIPTADANTFTVTATRLTGPDANKTISINQLGVVSGDHPLI